MEIRRAIPRDASEIARLEEEIFSDPWSEESIVSTISTEGAMCYTALSDGEVIAYVIGRQIPPEGEIYRIATREDKRGRGIAYRLLDYAVKTERGRGLEVLFLEVRERNVPARKLYTAYGFHEIDLRKNYYKDPQDNAVIMMLGDSQVFSE